MRPALPGARSAKQEEPKLEGKKGNELKGALRVEEHSKVLAARV